MTKIVYRSAFRCLLLLTCLVSVALVQAQSYSDSYESIAKGIYTAKGRAFLDLEKGKWQTTVGNTPSTQSRVLWEVREATLARTDFDYALGALQSASAEFHPAIAVTIRKGTKCLSYDINRIRYTNVGRLLPPSIDGPNPDWVRNSACSDITNLGGELAKHLEFSASPSKLFLGNAFAGSRENPDPIRPVSSSGVPGEPRPMITRIQFFPAVDHGVELPALEVQFRDATSLRLGRNSFVSLKGGSGFKFERLNYDVVNKAAEGTLHTLVLNLFSAKFESGNTKLIIEPNSPAEPALLEISNVTFYPNDRKVELTNGNVVTAISDGTQLMVDDVNARQSYLRFRSGRAIFRDFSATVYDNQAESFGFRDAVVSNVFITKGQLSLAQDQFLIFQNTHLEGRLNSCRWGPGGSLFSANLTRFGGDIIGGELKPNPQSLIKLASGFVNTTNLNIDGMAPQRVSGEFDDLRFTLAPDSLLAIPGKLEVTPRPGATFVAATAVNPLIMSPLKNGPAGVLEVNLQAEKIKATLGKLGSFTAQEGELQGSFTFAPDEALKGRIARLVLDHAAGTFRMNSVTNLVGVTNGVLKGSDLKIGGPFGLTGAFDEISFNVPEGNGFKVAGVMTIITRLDAAAPGRFEAKRPDTGIEFRDDLMHPVGTFKIHLPYLRMTTDAAALGERLELDGSNNGNADFKIGYDENGNISGSDGTLNGVLNISVMGIGLPVPIKISRGTFRTTSSTPVFGGHFSAVVPPIFKYPGGVTTPYQQNVPVGNDRMGGNVAFGVKMDIGLQTELKIESDFAVAAGMLNLTASADGTFLVVIPSLPRGNGGGEHRDRWNPGAGTKDEDEEYGSWQEAFVTTYDLPDPAGMCDAHLYLKDRSYVTSAHVNVRFINNKFGANISNIRPDRTPEFHRDGCTADVLLFVGSIIDNIVDNKIRDLLADKIGSLEIRIGNQDATMNNPGRQGPEISRQLFSGPRVWEELRKAATVSTPRRVESKVSIR
jgi:hypothetical protein